MPRLPQRSLALVLLAGILVSFFGALILTADHFPVPYDWRYRVISSLASPKDNPVWYPVATLGLAITGLLLAPFATYLRDDTRQLSRTLSTIAFHLHRLGCVVLILTALISGKSRWLSWHRIHEDLAELAGLFLGLAFALWTWCLLQPRSSLPLSMKCLLLTLAWVPLGGVVLSRLGLSIAHQCCSPLTYTSLKHGLFFSLAWWEWIGAVCLYLFLVLATTSKRT